MKRSAGSDAIGKAMDLARDSGAPLKSVKIKLKFKDKSKSKSKSGKNKSKRKG